MFKFFAFGEKLHVYFSSLCAMTNTLTQYECVCLLQLHLCPGENYMPGTLFEVFNKNALETTSIFSIQSKEAFSLTIINFIY